MPKDAFEPYMYQKPLQFQRYTKEYNDTVNVEQNTLTKIYLFQLWGPFMLCLYSGDPISCNLFLCM